MYCHVFLMNHSVYTKIVFDQGLADRYYNHPQTNSQMGLDWTPLPHTPSHSPSRFSPFPAFTPTNNFLDKNPHLTEHGNTK